MTKTKRIVSLCFLAAFISIGFVRWAKVTLQPLYSDARFEPTDKLHAGCTNSADILFSPQGQKLTKFTLVLYYNPETLEILRILPTANTSTASSKIEYNKIILEVDNPTFWSTTEMKNFFQLFFKSNTIGDETMVIGTGSEAVAGNKIIPLEWSFDLSFAQVPECEPDIIPPSINLIYPKDTQQKIALDQYFIFDIKDIGKWVDKKSVIINFDGEQYFYGSDNLKWNWDYLTFSPAKRIPIDESMDLNILVADQQSYGWANTTESKYSFQSATGMMLSTPITPMMFRMIAQQAEKISASVDECTLLANLYTTSEITQQKDIKSIIQKVWCDLSSIDTKLLEANGNVVDKMNTQQKQYRNISVFATLGRILFLIAFTLKMHYLVSYKKHKKLSEKLKTNNE